MITIKRNQQTAPDALTGAYKAAFRLSFNFLQQHTPAQHSADYWVQTTQDAAAITAQRPGDHLLMDLLLAVYSELERQCKTAEPVQGRPEPLSIEQKTKEREKFV